MGSLDGVRVPHASGAVVVARSLSIENIYAGYMEGGPDGAILHDRMERGPRGGPVPTCVRWDPSLSPLSSHDLIRRVSHWCHTAAISYVVDDETRDGVVVWLGGPVGSASIEEILLRGIGDAELDQKISRMVAPPQHGRRLEAVTADGVTVTTSSWELVFGPTRVDIDVPAGSVLASTRLSGPPHTPDRIETRSGRWESFLRWRALLVPGSAALGDVVTAAIARIGWRSVADERFDDWDDD